MTFLKSRTGSSRPLGCPDVVATAPDGYVNPLVIDAASGGGIFLGADWVSFTLVNSWVNYGGAYQVAQYRKIGDIVYLRGTIKSGASTACGLPVGCRPAATVQFVVPANGAYGQLVIDATGNILPAVGSNVSFGFDGVQFSIAP